jgi:hypothetical protein
MEPDERSAGILISLALDGTQSPLVVAKRFTRVRLETAPGSFVSIVLTDTGTYKVAEQVDPSRRHRLIAKGKLRSSRYVDDRGYDR